MKKTFRLKQENIKSFLLVLLLAGAQIASTDIFSQQNYFDTTEYQKLKLQGKIVQPVLEEIEVEHPPIPLPTDGGFLIPLDASFTVAMPRNDDGYTAEMFSPFNFQFYGNSLNSFFINNNGNVSFWNPYWQYTPSGFPINGFPMLAPFWADVDTRGSGSGLVYYKIAPQRVVVIWDNVGYYNSHYDKRNTFQLIFTNGNDPLIGIGNNVAFCFNDMQWTTGDASGGIGGFWGAPATVGANKGDGVNYFLIGRFDHEGTDYDGPGGNNDGVSFLDNSCYAFNTSGSSNNIPPIPQGFPLSQPVEIPLSGTYNLSVRFLSPEIGQTTNAIVNVPPGLNGFIHNVNPGNMCVVNIELTANSDNLGLHVIEFIATDNGSPPQSTTTTLQLNVTGFMQIEVEPSSMVESLCPNSTSVKQFTIANSGDGDVTFSISDNASWLSQSPSSGTILPGNTANIQVTFNTSGMTPNNYSGQIVINSNVPSTPNITIPVTLEVLPSLATYSTLTTGDNENNEGTGMPDHDLNVYLCKGDPRLPVEFNFFINQGSIQSAELIINAFDVDVAPMAGVPYPEKNEVYINGYYIGDLTGNNEMDHSTTLSIPTAYLISGPNGKNLVQIFVSTKGKYWCTNIKSAELRIYNCN